MIAKESVRALMSENTGHLGSVQTSFIAMAKETAKKRVEGASAAAKRAENLDAVIRAAEVVAEAVSQAGVLVAMGDPLPLGIKELLEAGPEGYWKVYFSKAENEKQLPGTTSTLQPDFKEAQPENQEKVKEKSSIIQQAPRNTDAGNTFEPLCLLFDKFNCWQTRVHRPLLSASTLFAYYQLNCLIFLKEKSRTIFIVLIFGLFPSSG